MFYPPRQEQNSAPQEIAVGDMVWTLGGASVEFVAAVLEDRAEYRSWSLSTPSVAITGGHPFLFLDHIDRQRLWVEEGIETTIYDQSRLDSEGIYPLTAQEKKELLWALSLARSKVSARVRKSPYRVATALSPIGTDESWRIHFIDGENLIFETIEIPFRPNTRRRENKSEMATPRKPSN